MNAPRVRFSHLGLHVHDLETMVAFYTGLMGLEITDLMALAASRLE